MLHLIRRCLFSHVDEEPANPGRGKTEENKEAAQRGVAGSSRQTFNFVLSQDTGSRGYLWSLSGGRRGKKESEREGLPLRRGCETVGPREAAVIPRALQEALENALRTHHRCFSAGVGGRGGVRPAKRVDVLLYLGAQVLSTL